MKLSPETGSAYPRTNPNHWIDVTAEDIPHGWMDDMVKRLFEIINRDLIRLENAQVSVPVEKGADGNPVPEQLDKVAQEIAKRQRLVAALQRSMERLTQMELKRQPERKVDRRKKVATSNDNTLSNLERRIAGLAAAAEEPVDPSGSDA